MADNNYQKTAMKQVNQRLDRFEQAVMQKLEQLTEAMVKLARTEEKMMNYDAKFAYIDTALKKHSMDIETVSEQVTLMEKNSAVANAKTDIYGEILKKAVWLLLIVLAGFTGANGSEIFGHLTTMFGG